MSYRANPFLDRMSERTTSDDDFVRLFSPNILERLEEDAFDGAVHIFRSPPGGGKTTLLRAFTPSALRAFWHARHHEAMSEAYRGLVKRKILHEQDGPQLLGVSLSCASGYADLPSGAVNVTEGLFRALLNCRIVLRTVRSLASFMGFSSPEQLEAIQLEYCGIEKDFRSIPANGSITTLMRWAEKRERSVYAELDSINGSSQSQLLADVRLEGLLWLQSVRFVADGKVIAPKRLLMIDDLHKLRRKHLATLIEDLTELRSAIPVLLAEQSIALVDELLSQGVRDGRDVRSYNLEEMWSTPRGTYQFGAFAQNILDRRFDVQSRIPTGSFSQHLRSQLQPIDVREEVRKGIEMFRKEADQHSSQSRYGEWLAHAKRLIDLGSVESVRDLYVTRILMARDKSKRQMTLDLEPLPKEELDQRDSSQVQSAAEIFMNHELKIPYYYGIDRLCAMATNNVEELLSLAAALYEGLLAKQVLRKEILLSPHEQEKLLKDAAKRKCDFIPKNHTEGTRARRILEAIGSHNREKTFLANAPYAPGVTGIRLSEAELEKLASDNVHFVERRARLRRVLAECVAENLLFTRPSAASTSRESGKVFYLNRTLCAHFGLPLQMGGWQDVSVEDLIEWMEHGRELKQLKLSELA